MICHTFCLIPLNSSSIQGDLKVYTVIFLMGVCVLGTSNFINVSSAASGCSSLHTINQQIFFTSSTYDSLHNFLYDLLYTILGPILVFLDIAIILWSLHPMDLDTALKQISAILVKMWSIHVDDLICVLFVTTLVGWLTTWTRLQALVTVFLEWAAWWYSAFNNFYFTSKQHCSLLYSTRFS